VKKPVLKSLFCLKNLRLTCLQAFSIKPGFFQALEKNLQFSNFKFSKLAIALSGLHAIAPSELVAVTAVYLKLILVIKFNFKSIFAFKAHYGRLGVPRVALGSVMYLASSLINHACDPTMYQVSYGSHIVYRAKRPVKKGEHLTDCYAASFSRSPYRERQKSCLEQYNFKCK
jgi:SET domain